ncbi:hypothetical protein TRIUR3_26126 [Triticum urartu]|uniref:Uncharacterized protein n=1 Tax=Triticum urartu TaxID=4572 RepID=M7ZDR6_TRIUA|nr:hypothetical protein TRIUR3_26126 [Triticum urartu]
MTTSLKHAQFLSLLPLRLQLLKPIHRVDRLRFLPSESSEMMQLFWLEGTTTVL